MPRLLKYILLLLCIAGSQYSIAQSRIQIMNADLMEFNDYGDKKIRTLTGNVKLEQNGVYLMCERADFDADANTVDASGSVHIQQDTINIYSDKLFYNGNDRKARLTGNVKLTDRKMILTTQQLDYDMKTRTGFYNTGGELRSDTSILTSMIGYYYATSRDVYFKKNVVLTNPRYLLKADTLRFNTDQKRAYFLGPTNILSDSSRIYCERGYYDTQKEITQFAQHAKMINGEQLLYADSIIYFKKQQYGLAYGNIRWADTIRKNIVRSQFARYDEKQSSILAIGNPVFIDASDKDTMFLKADTLYSAEHNKTDKRWLHAYHHVLIYKNTISARCDSIYYSESDSTFRFYKEPVLWVEANQLTADTISMTMSNKKLHSFLMIKNSIIINSVDSTRYNQIQGKRMTGYFEDGALYKLFVEGNGESIYYGEDDNKKLIGVNKAVCSNMIIRIRDNKVQRIKFLEKPTATLYPPQDAPESELKLKLFKWLKHLQPQRSDYP